MHIRVLLYKHCTLPLDRLGSWVAAKCDPLFFALCMLFALYLGIVYFTYMG